MQPFIDHYWCRNVDKSNDIETCFHQMPNVEVEMVFHIQGNRLCYRSEDTWLPVPLASITGIMQHIAYTKLKGSAKVIGIRFKAEGFAKLYDMPVAALTDKPADLSMLLGKEIDGLFDRLVRANEFNFCIEFIELFLAQKLEAMYDSRSYLFEAPKVIRASFTDFSLEETGKSLSIGSRQLQRTFKEMYGVSPKAFQRITRFYKAYKYIQQVGEVNWSAAACDFGYADQAHLIRDFNEFTSSAPSSVRCPPEHLVYC